MTGWLQETIACTSLVVLLVSNDVYIQQCIVDGRSSDCMLPLCLRLCFQTNLLTALLRSMFTVFILLLICLDTTLRSPAGKYLPTLLRKFLQDPFSV